MIANEVIREVERLIAERQLSQRAISARTGISTVMVNRIAAGKRKIKLVAKVDRQHDSEQWRKPYYRCKGCGGKVQIPCLRCAIKNGTADERPAFSERHERAAMERIYTPTPDELTKFYEEQRNLREAVYANAKYEPTEEEEDFDDEAFLYFRRDCRISGGQVMGG